MNRLAIIGSDSYIASHLSNSVGTEASLRLFSRQPSGKMNEIIRKDLFDISADDLRGCESVINFTAIVHRPRLRDDDLYQKVNTDLAVHLAVQAKKAGVRQYVQMSSIAVYGNQDAIDISSPVNPVNIYGETKLAADTALVTLTDETFNISIIRPPMVYGGGNAPGNMMKLIEYTLKGIPMPFGKVENKRDFIHVLNLVQVLKTVIQNNLHGVILPTDRKPVSTSDIIDSIKRCSSARVRTITLPRLILKTGKILIPGLYNKIFSSLTVACNLPDSVYSPLYTPDDGIREMVSYLEGRS